MSRHGLLPEFCLLLLACVAAFGQFEAAAVIGVVQDQAGAVVVAGRVTLENTATGVGKSAVTDANGNYTFLDVRPGTYTVKAEAPGFKAAVAEPFVVTVNARQRVDLQLQVGSISEEVTVSGAASAVETDTSSRGQVVANSSIVNLPLNGRSYADLALLVPGVRKSLIQDGSATQRDASFNVNGMRSALNNFMIDGVDNNAYGTSNQGFSNQVVQVNPDALAEFRVETSNYSAEYGRAAGAVINATTRSGTNAVHGSLWEYLRNTRLNAIGFFKPRGGVKPVFIQNQFGAAVGGPVRKDKLFYFFDYEGLRRITRTLTFAQVPTADQRAGKFETPVRNPLTGEVYADGNVPLANQTKFARLVLDALPAPNVLNTPNNTNNFQSLPRSTIQDNKGDARIDYYWSSRISSYFRYSHRESGLFVPGNIPGPAGGNENGNVYVSNRQLNPGVTLVLSPNSTLEARLGVNWSEGGKSPIGLGEPSLLEQGGITGLPQDPLIKGALNTQNVNGYSIFGRQTSNPQFQNPSVFNPKLNYARIMGRHALKAGYEYQRIDTTINDFAPVYGTDMYNGQFSRPSGTPLTSTPLLLQAYNLADFLVGARSSYELNNFVIVDYRQRMHFAYIQDDIKTGSKLTLNLGVRYEFATPQWEKDNHLANFDPATRALIPAKAGSIYNRALVEPRRKYFAPRLGLAWQIRPNMVLRSAYGISYVHFNRLGGENLLAYNGPYVVNAQIVQDPSQLPLCASPASDFNTCFRPTQFGYPQNFAVPENFNQLRAQARYIPGDNPTGYVQSWHFTVQKELATNLVLDAGYVGNKGTHLMILGDFNQARPNAPAENTSLQNRRPYSDFGNIEVAFGGGISSYHALQLKLEKRYSAGLTLLNSFTWSKAIDNASGHLETASGDSSRVNYRSLANEKAVSSYNQPFNDTLSAVISLPFGAGRRWGRNWNRIVDGAAGGWQTTVINTIASGLPINITYDAAGVYQVSSIGISMRPDLAGALLTPEDRRGPSNYLDPAGVRVPASRSTPFGTLGRNAARGPGFFQLDLGLHKEFRLRGDASRLQFRAEAFNLTNRTNFKAPASNRTGSDYGIVTTTFPARQIQFALRLMF